MGINSKCRHSLAARIYFFLLSLIIFLFSVDVIAASFDPRLSTQLYTQIRKNTIDENQWPFIEYLNAGVAIESFDLDVDLKVMGDPLMEDADFDLYATRLQIRDIGDVLSLTVGRQSVLSGFSYDLMDGMDVLFSPDFMINMEIYGGLIRFIELDEFNDYNVAAGGRVFLNGFSYTELSVEFRYERLKNDFDWTEIGVVASHTLDSEIKPRFFASFNGDVTNKIITQATLGASLSPVPYHFSLEVSRYDYKLDYLDPWEDIFSLFATSAMWEFKQSAGYVVNDSLTLFQSYSLTRYNYDLTGTAMGHVVRLGGDLKAIADRLGLLLTVFFNQSYGGRSYGASGRARFLITQSLFAGLRGGVLSFDKITGESDNASFFLLEAGYRIIKGLEIVLGGEFNSNDQFKRDLRANVALKYEFM